MWPRYETVVQHAKTWHSERMMSGFNVATVRDRGATTQGGKCNEEDQVSMWPRYETVVQPSSVPAALQPGGVSMWPRYETVVQLSVVFPFSPLPCRFQCGHGTRPWCNSTGTAITNCTSPFQCGHGTRPWCNLEEDR